MSNIVYQIHESIVNEYGINYNTAEFAAIIYINDFISRIQPSHPPIERTIILQVDPMVAVKRCELKNEKEDLTKLKSIQELYFKYMPENTLISNTTSRNPVEIAQMIYKDLLEPVLSL